MLEKIKVIGFDADDTLWVNEPFYRQSEMEFAEMLSDYGDEEYINNEFLRFQLANLDRYGYGIKSFILSMIETALFITNNKANISIINDIIDIGKRMIDKPVELLDGVKATLEVLSDKGYTLIVATKGDLLDQERKLNKSGIEKFFHHIEIMSDKTEFSYRKILKHLDINAEEFMMVGNSMKSDIIPVIDIGGNAIHIPFHTTWIHEQVDSSKDLKFYREMEDISEVVKLFSSY